jgi:hypothetical protein
MGSAMLASDGYQRAGYLVAAADNYVEKQMLIIIKSIYLHDTRRYRRGTGSTGFCMLYIIDHILTCRHRYMIGRIDIFTTTI